MTDLTLVVPSLALAIVVVVVVCAAYAYVVLRWVMPWYLRVCLRFVKWVNRRHESEAAGGETP